MKKGLKISDRDKKLLILIICVGILALAYFFGFRTFMSQYEKYHAECTELEKTKKDLQTKTNNRKFYEDETMKNTNYFNTILSKYETGTSQDASLDFLNKVELITGSWVNATTFVESEQLYAFGSGYASDCKAYKTTLNLSYEANYDQWKQLVTFVNNYPYKCTIENISMTYSSADTKVQGGLRLATYSVVGENRVFNVPNFTVPTGTDNIFDSSVY